jgi:hypothetical protein
LGWRGGYGVLQWTARVVSVLSQRRQEEEVQRWLTSGEVQLSLTFLKPSCGINRLSSVFNQLIDLVFES